MLHAVQAQTVHWDVTGPGDGNLVPKASQGADGTLRSSCGGSDTHDVGILSVHPDHGPVDPSQQPFHHLLYVLRRGALGGGSREMGTTSSDSAALLFKKP